MSLTDVVKAAIGPFGALVLSLIANVYLWRRLEQAQQMLVVTQGLLTRSQDLFEEALKVIKDDLLPLVRDITSGRR